ncbi:Peptidase [Candidatus Magnetomoraceae bacterium gMMP-15]
MFDNFIYFIIGVLIYATYHSPESAYFSADITFTIFVGLILIFTFITRSCFRRLEKEMDETGMKLYQKFDRLSTKSLCSAIIFFAINIYGLNLKSFFESFPVFGTAPTILAILFLGLFTGYLAIVWACSHGAYERIYEDGVSRSSYVKSNVSFSIPVLLPWFVISGITDIIEVLPFNGLKEILNSTPGQIVYFVLFLVTVSIVAPVIIQKFWGCTPLPEGFYRERIEAICKRAKLKYSNILYWPILGGNMITAGVMGLVKKFRYILVTKALLQAMSPEELDSVISHEIGHIKRKHLLFYLIFFVGYIVVSYALLELIAYSIIYSEPVYSAIIQSGQYKATLTSVTFAFVTAFVFIIYFRYIFGYFMRNFERQADLYVFTMMGHAYHLISSLEKIAFYSGRPSDKPNWHHFNISERIDYLKKSQSNPKWIDHHEQKIKRSMFIYLIGILLIGIMGYNIHFGEMGKNFEMQISEKVIEHAIEEYPDNPILYSMLGNIFLQNKKFGKAIIAYKTSLSINEKNPEVLNNLAWLYAASKDETYFDPFNALKYAEKAAKLDQSPYILDTLAESYYVNGMLEKAVKASKKALSLNPENRGYYEEQLKKFKQAF